MTEEHGQQGSGCCGGSGKSGGSGGGCGCGGGGCGCGKKKGCKIICAILVIAGILALIKWLM